MQKNERSTWACGPGRDSDKNRGAREELGEGVGRGTEKKEGRRGGEHEVTIMYKA